MIQRLSFVFLLLLPGLVYALGLGKLELRSNLNEPFEARISLISPTVDELASLNVLLADQEAFQRADIRRSPVLRHLRFTVVEPETGADYIRIFSDEPIREPFLNFLLELNWSKGRLFREYTVLLDPPIYAAKQQRLKSVEPDTPTRPAASEEPRAIEDNRVVYNPEYTPPTTRAAPVAPAISPVDYTGGDFGPVEAGNTLWSIASAMRPDESVSVQQMMLALLRTNPDAFINNNINGLKRGQVLRMPDLSEIRQTGRAEAFAEARQQNLAWQGVAPATPAVRAEGTPVTEAKVSGEASAEIESGGEAELRLVAAAEKGEGAAGDEPTTEDLNQELALVNESLEALKQENAELQDKLIESEAIIDDLRRLIVLKEEELAALQQQIAAGAPEEIMAEEAAPAPAETEVAEEAVEEPAPAAEMAEEEPAPVAEEEEAAPVTEVSLLDKAKAFITTFIPMSFFTNLAGLVRDNLALAGGALGALLLLIVGGVYFKRRQADKESEAPAGEFPEFDDMDETVAGEEAAEEDSTDINPALSESEDRTEAPVSEEGPGEFDLTAEDEEETQAVAPDKAADEFEETTTEKPAAAAEEEEDDEDRLAEVNVFLAYEHFDQAADFVKDAIEEQPDNLEFHSKLLEVYYAAGDKKNYEEAARVLHDKVGGQGEYWDMAVAMWQEMSPNRALFEEPAAGEEEEEAGARTEGGGIVNIAGDEETAASSTGLDFDLDTTADSEQEEEASTDEDEADVLDVTAAVSDEEVDEESDEEDEVLDLTAAEDTGKEDDEVLDLTAAEDSGDDEVLDLTAADDDSGKEEESDALDFSLDEGVGDKETEESEQETPTGAEDEDNALDFSLDEGVGDKETEESEQETLTGAEDEDNALDFSLDETGGSDDTDQQDKDKESSLSGSEGDSLDFSVGGDEDETAAGEEKDSLDFSLDDTGEGDDSSLDISVQEAAGSDSGEESLDASSGDTGDDLSLDLDIDEDESSGDKGEDRLDISLDESGEDTGESPAPGHDPLDVTSSISGEGEENEDIMDVSGHREEDLLDVTSSASYEPEGDEELLDLTSATAEGVDKNEQVEVDADDEDSATSSDNGIDFDNGSMDKNGGDKDSIDLEIDESEDSGLTLDVTGGQDEDSGFGLDLEFGDEEEAESSESESDDSDIDMDATMEFSGFSTTTGNKLDLSDTADDSSDTESSIDLEIDSEEEEDDGEEHTVFVGRSSETEEQSDEDEIATQLDLAKAYIELGDTDNARTILNEIISVGNDQQRQQAEELLSQV